MKMELYGDTIEKTCTKFTVPEILEGISIRLENRVFPK